MAERRIHGAVVVVRGDGVVRVRLAGPQGGRVTVVYSDHRRSSFVWNGILTSRCLWSGRLCSGHIRSRYLRNDIFWSGHLRSGCLRSRYLRGGFWSGPSIGFGSGVFWIIALGACAVALCGWASAQADR